MAWRGIRAESSSATAHPSAAISGPGSRRSATDCCTYCTPTRRPPSPRCPRRRRKPRLGGCRSVPVVDLYPAIDIRHGRVGRLSQGEATRQTVYGGDPVAVAERFAEQGAEWIHVVDLDRAFGEGDNLAVVQRIVARAGSRVRVQLGGGLRSLARVRSGLEHGVSRVVFGTAAAFYPAMLPALLAAEGAERIVVGIDARDGHFAIPGSTETS